MITGESETKTLPSFLAAAMEKASKEELSAALHVLLAPYFLTTFRAARAQDHEVAAIRAMQTLNALGPSEDEHDWMLRLRVTRAKARNLVYQVHLHQLQDEAVLDDEVRRVMAKPIIEKGRSGQRDTHWVLDIPTPPGDGADPTTGALDWVCVGRELFAIDRQAPRQCLRRRGCGARPEGRAEEPAEQCAEASA